MEQEIEDEFGFYKLFYNEKEMILMKEEGIICKPKMKHLKAYIL